MNKKLGNIFTFISATLLVVTGFAYLLRNSFMPYHSVAVEMEWSSIDTNMQWLLLALMRATAGGYIAVGVTVFFLQYKYNKHRLSWIPALTLLSGFLNSAISMYATILVRTHTNAKPPTFLAIAGIIILLVGFIFNMKVLRENK